MYFSPFEAEIANAISGCKWQKIWLLMKKCVKIHIFINWASITNYGFQRNFNSSEAYSKPDIRLQQHDGIMGFDVWVNPHSISNCHRLEFETEKHRPSTQRIHPRWAAGKNLMKYSSSDVTMSTSSVCFEYQRLPPSWIRTIQTISDIHIQILLQNTILIVLWIVLWSKGGGGVLLSICIAHKYP